MATTVVAPVGNSISLAQKYTPLLDEVYKAASRTAVLDVDRERIEWVGANTAKIFKISTVSMAEYDRNAGFVPGDANGSWETMELEVDRGRSYQIDAMDNEETLGMMVGNTLGEVERVQIVPELDAYRFAKMASATGITTVNGTVTDQTDVAALIFAAEATMDDDEVPDEGRILFVNPTVYSVLKTNIERRIVNSENNVAYEVEYFDNMRVIKVPSARFNTAVTLNEPTAHDGAGGFTATGSTINFMIVHPSAVMGVIKHNPIRIFSPEQNIEADAYRINVRYYGDIFVLDNKVKGIYVHCPSGSSA
ncbi:MAG: hypothetical protein J6S14_21945 [Clostridia bacterium]|nr:hypothetical protein [Clostridia bacterium]